MPINLRSPLTAANSKVADSDGADVRPIGVFDSGIGGLTVVSALQKVLPNERIFYLGDTARVPYGGKSAVTVERYSLEIAGMLLEENCKTIVVACNTASALALPLLEQTLSVPVIGVISPGAQAAVATTRNKHIGVIGTRATIKSGAYERALRSLDSNVETTAVPCPLLVPLIEEGWLQNEITDRVIKRYLEPLVQKEVDTLVLGCTHYPLLRDAILRFLGDRVRLVDSAENCAIAVRELLMRHGLSAPQNDRGGLEVALTDQPDAFLQIARDALQLDLGEIRVREVLHVTKAL
jgi:glutamate racemase